MEYKRRSALGIALALLTLVTPGPALSQQFPAKPIKIIVGASTGTTTDALARFYAERLTTRLKVPVVVENRGGAGALLGYMALTKADADGHTIMLSGAPLYLLPLSPETAVKFDPIKDFTPIARVARAPLAIVTRADSPYRTLADLMQAMKVKPEELTYSSQGIGSSAHLCGALLNDMSRTKAKHVPYKESSLATTDVVGGIITYTCQGSVGVLPLVKGGKLRALAVTSTTRWDSLPDVPTAAQAGVQDFEMAPGLEFIARAGTPEPIVNLLADAIMQIAKEPQYKEMVDKNAILPDLLGPKALGDMMIKDMAYWKRAVDAARGS